MRRLSDGRQRRSREEWQQILSRFEASGLSETAFCRRGRLNRNTFRLWRKRLEGEPSGGAAFVELALPSPQADAATFPRLETGTFEIRLPGGVSLHWKP